MEKLLERFWNKVDKTEACWLWKAGKSHGYGVFSVKAKPHLFDKQNTRFLKNGKRRCRKCNVIRDRKYKGWKKR